MDTQFVPNKTDFFLNDVPRDLSSLGILAATIAYFNFEWRYTTLVMFNALDDYSLHSFLRSYDRSIIVKLGRFLPHIRTQIPQFVIFGQSSTEIIATVRFLDFAKYDISGKYIIVCPSSELHTCEERQIFQTLAKHYILSAVLLKKSTNNEPLVYSYQIIKPGKCINGEPDLLDWAPKCKNSTCFQSIFYEKISNFHLCPLYISTLEQPPFMYLNKNASNPSGGDGEVIKLVANLMNATLIMRKPENGYDTGHYENGSWTGCLGDAFNSRAHASMCLAPLTSHKYDNFQISFPYYSMDIVWAAKYPALRPYWEKIVNPLKNNIRVMLLFIFIGIIFVNTVVKMNICRKLIKTFKIVSLKQNLLFYSWLIFLGMPVSRMSNRVVFQILICTWVWFSFIIRSAYQAALISSLKHNVYQAKLNNWSDVLCFSYGGMPSFREYFHDNHEIFDNWTNVNFADTFQILDEILDGNSDFVLALHKDIIIHSVMKYNGSKHLQVLPEKIVRSPTVMFFKKFSPLTGTMNKILRAIYEGGFIQHIYNKYLMNENQFKLKTKVYEIDRLKVQHFSGCFIVLIVGYCLSFIYFLVEFICSKLNHSEREPSLN
ncbi:hypothetical protein K1T71_005627 [Dendrolimus kikuchii]|uniref:Uncharacterized protein n=1 Tax=Dendrolimus kikuchii TaxID=765133 RepID=A0ACC1D617_9NEOP|nr:hypothetical protein K1T71_005627 [Dendrolimus kikuchii]